MYFYNTNYYTSSFSLVVSCVHYGIRKVSPPPWVKTLHLIGWCRPPKANRDVISSFPTQTTLKECMLLERPYWVLVFNLQVWNCRLILSPGSLLSSLLIHATVTAIKSNSNHTPSPIKPRPCWGRPHDNESGDNWVISRPQLQNRGEEPLGDTTSRLKVPTERVLLPQWALPALVSQLKLLLGDTK